MPRLKQRIGATARRPGIPDYYTFETDPLISSAPFAGEQGGDWCISIGEWGDSIAAVGHSKTMGVPDGARWFLLGSDPTLPNWMGLQTGSNPGGHTLKSANSSWYLSMVVKACQRTDEQEPGWAEYLFGLAGIKPDRIWKTQVNATTWPYDKPQHWKNPVISNESMDWASDVLKAIGGKPVVLHPYSNSSTAKEYHWDKWPKALNWLSKQGVPMILTGRVWPEEWGALPKSNSVVNLIGKTSCMEQIYALTRLSGRVITTANSLSMWSVVSETPTVVCCHSYISSDMPDAWYRRWINAEPNRLLDVGASLNEWKKAVTQLLEDTK